MPPSRRRRGLRLALLLLVVVPLVLIGAALLLLQIEGVSTRVVNEALRRTLPWPNASVARADLSGLGHVVLQDLRLETEDGDALVRIDSVNARVRTLSLLRRRVEVRSLHVGGLHVDMRQRADSTWDLLAPLEEAADTAVAADTTGRGLRLRMANIEIHGASLRAEFAPDSVLRVEDVTVVLDTLALADPLHVVLDTLDARILPPSRPESPAHLSAGLRVASGSLTTRGIRLVSDSSDVRARGALMLPDSAGAPVRDIDFEVSATPLDFRDVGALVPGFDAPGSLRLDARVTGSTDSIHVRADAESFDGASLHVEGSLTPKAEASVRYALVARVRDLDPGLWSAEPPPLGGIDAELDVDLGGPALDSLDGTVHAELSSARLADGTLRPTTLDARFERGAATFEVEGAAAPWVRFALEGTARPLDSIPEYEVRGTLRQLDPLDAAGTRLADAVARIEASGTGISPETARGTATLGLDGVVGRARVRRASLDATWDSSTARFALDLPAGSGLLEARGHADWSGDATSLALTSMEGSRLDVAELFADTASGFVSLTGSAEAILTDRGAAVVEADLAIEQAAWGELVLDTGTVSLRLRDSTLVARVRAVTPGGVITLDGRGLPFAPVPSWDVDSLQVRGLDLAEVRQGLPATDLHAVLRGRVRGVSPSEMTGRGTLALDSSRIAGTSVEALDVRFTLEEGRLAVDGDARALGGTLALEASAQPFAAAPSFRIERARFDTLRIHRAVGSDEELVERLSLSGTLEAHATLPPDTFPQAAGRLRLDGGHLNGEPIDTAGVTFEVEGAEARLDALVRTAAGVFDVQGLAELVRDTGALSMRSARVEGNLDLPSAGRLLGGDTVEAALSGRFALSGSGTRLETMVWDADVLASGRYEGARLDSLTLDARLDRGVFLLDTLAVQGNVLRGGGGGAVALLDEAQAPDTTERPLRIRLDADSTALLSPLVGMRPLSLRGASIELDAARDGGELRVEGMVGAGGLITSSVSADTLRADFTAWLRDLSLRRADLELDGERIALPTTILQSTHGTVAYDSTGAAFTVDARQDEGHDIRLQGRAEPSDSALYLDTLNFRMEEQSWRLVRPAAVRWGNRIDPDSVTLVSDHGRIALAGHLDRTGTQDLTLRMDSVQVDGFAALLGFERLEGVLDGLLEVSGPASDVALDGRFDATVNDAVVHVRLLPTEGPGLGVEARVLDGQGDPLRIEGVVPVDISLAPGGGEEAAEAGDGIALEITADQFSPEWLLPFLDPLGVQRLDADLSAQAHLEGTLEDPSLTGSAALARGTVEIPAQGIAYEDMRGALTFRGDRVRIDSLLARSGGTASVEGEILLEPLNRPTLDLRVETRRFVAASNDWTRLVANGDLSLSGDLAAPVVEGSVQLENTDVFADLVGESGSAAPVELTQEDYRMLESYFGFRPTSSAAVQREALERWTIDLTVDLGTDVWLRRRTQPELNVQLTGQLDVRKEPGDSIQLFGTVEVLPARSYFEQFGRRFQVETGVITFNGPITNWQMDAVAQFEVPSFDDPTASEVTITLDVSGSPGDLSLTLGSQPSMDNADVLSYLATGRPAESAVAFGGQGQGDDSGGGVLGLGEELALSRVAGVLERSAAESVGLDVVEIRQSGTRGTTIIAGRYVNPRLFVGFEQPLTSKADREDPTRNAAALQTEVEIEYTWFRWLLVNVQGGQSALRFFLRTKYAF